LSLPTGPLGGCRCPLAKHGTCTLSVHLFATPLLGIVWWARCAGEYVEALAPILQEGGVDSMVRD